MRITLNGEELECSLNDETSVGDVLVSLDEWLEAQGLIITGLSLDGRDFSGEIEALKDQRVEASGELAIQAAFSADWRAEALSQGISFLEKAASDPAAPGLAAQGRSLLESHSGLLDAEELSVTEAALSSLEGGKAAESLGAAREFLDSRLSEIRDPLSALSSSVAEYAASRQAISSLPVLLQTSRDREAMEELGRFTALFSRALRIIPLARLSGASLPERYGDAEAADFHRGLNDILKELTEAFVRRDSVLIGDICEYELLPRLDAFFDGLKASIPSGGLG